MLDFWLHHDPEGWRLVFDVACTFGLGFVLARVFHKGRHRD